MPSLISRESSTFKYLFYVVCAFLLRLSIVVSAVKYTEFVVDQGKNLSFPCASAANGPVMWVRDGRKEDGSIQEIQLDGSLVLTNLTVHDSGVYTCSTIMPSSTTKTDEETFVEVARVKVTVRTTPGPVVKLMVRPSTIIAVIIWEVWPNRSGGYPVRDFTAEMRRAPESAEEEETIPWELLDPHHISPNARQLEIYRLTPNTTYEFRIWPNNQLGAGEKTSVLATTVPKIEEKDLIRRIMVDAQNFDTRVWIAAVAVVMGALVILSIGTCLVLYKECRDSSATEESDSLELVPNIILNPGFCESDDQREPSPITTRTLGLNFHQPQSSSHHLSPANYEQQSDEEDEPMTFSRKMSIFFTGNTIKRI